MKRTAILAICLVLAVMGIIGGLYYRNRNRAAIRRILQQDPAALMYPIPKRSPLTVSFVGVTNDNDGSRVASFCMSNRSPKTLLYIGNGTSLPYCDLIEYFPPDKTGMVVMTNHNQQQAFQARSARLQPKSNLTFSVRIPAGVTGEVIVLHYMPQRITYQNMVQELKRALGMRGTHYAYENFPIREPFDSFLRQ